MPPKHKCNRDGFDDTHDAAYCTVCLNWCEPVCGDKDCGYCADRPEKAEPTKK